MHASTSALLLASALGLAQASPMVSARQEPFVRALEPSADSWEIANAPITDYDGDCCYHTSAIQSDGTTNPGLESDLNVTGGRCREPERLENQNVYSRKQCNNGWCAISYNYYFEKDASTTGHRHDWEDIIVFVSQADKGVKKIVHGKHTEIDGTSDMSQVLFDGNHAKMVYHRDGQFTRFWRFGTSEDDAAVENYTGKWIEGRLIGWSNWPAGDSGLDLRTTLYNAWPSGVCPKFWDQDNAFQNRLRDAREQGDGGASVPDFDPYFHEEPAPF